MTTGFVPANVSDRIINKKLKSNKHFLPIAAFDCEICEREFEKNITYKRPTSSTFNKYLQYFLNDIPTEHCAKAGHAAYSNAIKYKIENDNYVSITDSYFMSYHTSLTASSDFYTSLRNARIIANDVKSMLEAKLNRPVKFYPYRFKLICYAQLQSVYHILLLFSVFFMCSMNNTWPFGMMRCSHWGFRCWQYSVSHLFWPDLICCRLSLFSWWLRWF